MVEFVDRYSATGTPYPCPWTVCKGRCKGMGVYPTPQRSMGIEPKEPPYTDDDWWFVTCEECGGTGTRVRGKKAYYLQLAYTFYYQLWWPLWAVWHEMRRGFEFVGWRRAYGVLRLPRWARFMHGEQRRQRALFRATTKRRAS